ncbi:hypothetical protein ACJX0J_035985, partial [Zea mays]
KKTELSYEGMIWEDMMDEQTSATSLGMIYWNSNLLWPCSYMMHREVARLSICIIVVCQLNNAF